MAASPSPQGRNRARITKPLGITLRSAAEHS